MFNRLPEEIIRIIWRKYYSYHVLPFVRSSDSVWIRNNIKKLVSLCKEDRCYETHHSDIERIERLNKSRQFVFLTRYRFLSQNHKKLENM